MENKAVEIIKIGGSCFSDKKTPKSFSLDVIDSIMEQLASVEDSPFIIVHGGGSFGHPPAKEYKIGSGLDPSVQNQVEGFCLTRDAMIEANTKIVSRARAAGLKAYTVQPSAIFKLNDGNVADAHVSIIDDLLDLGTVPVLHGDPATDITRGFGILSGDAIIVELSNKLRHEVSRIIYLLDVDGLYDKDPKEDKGAKLITRVKIKDETCSLETEGGNVLNWNLALLASEHSRGTIDVTGGIMNKARELARLQKPNIDVFFINGRRPGALVALNKGSLDKYTFITVNQNERDY